MHPIPKVQGLGNNIKAWRPVYDQYGHGSLALFSY
jgi:hypothetical protein